jgi:hypothetical protein
MDIPIRNGAATKLFDDSGRALGYFVAPEEYERLLAEVRELNRQLTELRAERDRWKESAVAMAKAALPLDEWSREPLDESAGPPSPRSWRNPTGGSKPCRPGRPTPS